MLLPPNINKRAQKLKTKTKESISLLSAMVATLGLVVAVAPGAATAMYPSHYSPTSTIYDNIPNHVPGNVPSVGFEATSTSEFGSQIKFSGNQRKNPTVTVLMSSWACKSGSWDKDNCITNPGSTFNHPVTLNVYNVNNDDSPGSLIESVTKTFTMPYRPTADDGTNCNTANGTAGEWWDGHQCNNGKTFPVSFDLKGTTLPDDAIVTVAYNTSDYGAHPLGDATACHATPQGCPYDSLNVGTNPTPSVGTSEPSANDAYVSSTWGGAYCDNGASGTGSLRLDAGCWTGYLPAIKVAAANGKGRHGHYPQYPRHDDHRYHHGDKDHHDRYGGFRGFYGLKQS
ncbi:MAG TPA: hypothetical protein VHA05_00970 [Candidatus Saccharimonadales bacterium]|nr:hypothetical protein [Candidatus Saccharimonadales bacterium]